jgi:hypothetical protein
MLRALEWEAEISQTSDAMPRGAPRRRLERVIPALAVLFVALEDSDLPPPAINQIVKTLCMILASGKPLPHWTANGHTPTGATP